MVTVLRAEGLRVVIFLNDHPPAHVHVFGDGESKIDLEGADVGPDLIWSVGANAAEVRKAMRIVAEQQQLLLLRWSELHG